MTTRTKIVATLGPASATPERVSALIAAGVDVFRINASHTKPPDIEAAVARVRAASDDVAVLLDLKGPDIRVTEVDGVAVLEDGAEVFVRYGTAKTDAHVVHVDYPGFEDIIVPGDRVLLVDGLITLVVLDRTAGGLRCRVLAGGPITSRKGVNVPNTALVLVGLTSKDEADLRQGARLGVDFVALSFVSRPGDVLHARRLLDEEGSSAAIVAKIESRQGIDRLAEILEVADAILVARGDMGVEIPPEEVPLVQKRLVAAAIDAGKPVIVATQMLESMIESAVATRAETSDVANAILDGADAVMLSAETAVGKYPVEAVRTMDRIAAHVEGASDLYRRALRSHGTVADVICRSATLAAEELGLTSIVCPTATGQSARNLARYRPKAPILAATPSAQVRRQLALVSGVVAVAAPPWEHMGQVVAEALERLLARGLLSPSDRVAVAAGLSDRVGVTNLLWIDSVQALRGVASAQVDFLA